MHDNGHLWTKEDASCSFILHHCSHFRPKFFFVYLMISFAHDTPPSLSWSFKKGVPVIYIYMYIIIYIISLQHIHYRYDMIWPLVECFRSQEEVVPELPALDDGDATPSAIRLESRKKKFTVKVTWHPSGWDGGEVDLFFSFRDDFWTIYSHSWAI